MVRGKIRFNTPDDVANFVRAVSKFDTDIDVKQRTAVLDGKSINGLLALQLQVELECIIHSGLSECTGILEAIREYTVSDFEEFKRH